MFGLISWIYGCVIFRVGKIKGSGGGDLGVKLRVIFGNVNVKCEIFKWKC